MAAHMLARAHAPEHLAHEQEHFADEHFPHAYAISEAIAY